MAFLLALGFNNPQPRAYELVARAFQIVHDAAEKDELGYDNWRLLNYQVPTISWWRNWDKCERLRRALVEKFIKYEWPAEYFKEVVKNQKTRDLIMLFCRTRHWTKEFLDKIAY